MRRIVSFGEFVDIVHSLRGEWFFSLSTWRFHFEWEPEVFKSISQIPAMEFGDLGFFRIPSTVGRDEISRVFRYPWVRVVVSSPTQYFFDSGSGDFLQKLSDDAEFDVGALTFAEHSKGRTMLALREGDEGDYYFYLFIS